MNVYAKLINKKELNMSKLDLYEQEQISNVQYFFKDYGKYIITMLLIIIISYIASVLWLNKQKKQSLQSAELYSNLIIKLEQNQINDAYNIANKLNQDYKNEEYTSFANLLIAKEAFSKKDYVSAVKYINELINNSKDKSMVAIAKLRLADIYIDQNKLDNALKLLADKHDSDFDVLFYQKQGDIYLLKKDIVKAKDLYNAALQSAGGNQDLMALIKMKMDFAS
jgi:predicted negative regulator of RcsB-dependent stress response